MPRTHTDIAGPGVTETFTAIRTHARTHGLPLSQVATAVIDGTLDAATVTARVRPLRGRRPRHWRRLITACHHRGL